MAFCLRLVQFAALDDRTSYLTAVTRRHSSALAGDDKTSLARLSRSDRDAQHAGQQSAPHDRLVERILARRQVAT